MVLSSLSTLCLPCDKWLHFHLSIAAIPSFLLVAALTSTMSYTSAELLHKQINQIYYSLHFKILEVLPL